MIPSLDDRSILRLVQIALTEDIGTGDVSSEALIDHNELVHGRFLAKERGVIAGSVIAGLVLGEVDRTIECDWLVNEGELVEAGTPLAHIHGPASSILTAERTALNFMQRMSGVATRTRMFVDLIVGTNATILDTRKTIPGWRLLDKYAVKCGGGQNHRMGLYDMVMIKDNHIAAHGSITAAIRAVQSYLDARGLDDIGIEVETQTLAEVAEVLKCDGVQRVMFDNFELEALRGAVSLVGNDLETEASGGVNLNTVREIAETGVQFISVGALTHSATALDISLDFKTVSTGEV